jgi:hypothetical protein
MKIQGKGRSMQQADEVLLEVNIYPPLEFMMKTFLKRILYWLISRQAPIEEGDAFVIPPDILLEFDVRTHYSYETPIVRVLITKPKGDVWITADTDLTVDFKPSSQPPIRVSMKEIPPEKNPLFREFLKEIGFSFEKYETLDQINRNRFLYAFRLWLTKRNLKYTSM